MPFNQNGSNSVANITKYNDINGDQNNHYRIDKSVQSDYSKYTVTNNTNSGNDNSITKTTNKFIDTYNDTSSKTRNDRSIVHNDHSRDARNSNNYSVEASADPSSRSTRNFSAPSHTSGVNTTYAPHGNNLGNVEPRSADHSQHDSMRPPPQASQFNPQEYTRLAGMVLGNGEGHVGYPQDPQAYYSMLVSGTSPTNQYNVGFNDSVPPPYQPAATYPPAENHNMK